MMNIWLSSMDYKPTIISSLEKLSGIRIKDKAVYFDNMNYSRVKTSQIIELFKESAYTMNFTGKELGERGMNADKKYTFYFN